MGRIEELADLYSGHIETPWQRTIAGAQRVIIVVYDKELERVLRARKGEFENRTRAGGHGWREVDVTDAFAAWLGSDEYRDAYFESPEDLAMKLAAEFPDYVADRIRTALMQPDVDDNSVVAVIGAGSLFGLVRVSQVIKLIESEIRGRLVLFFPGQFGQNNYQLLDAQDGWNYMAIPISIHAAGGIA